MSPRILASEIDDRLSKDRTRATSKCGPSRRSEKSASAGFLGVGQGSAQPTRLVYATYDPEPGSTTFLTWRWWARG
jgi:leucyl aminopeptidase